MCYEWSAANQLSQRVSHSSTHQYADGLIFRVRDGYGRNPAAVAALTPINGIEPLYIGRRRLPSPELAFRKP